MNAVSVFGAAALAAMSAAADVALTNDIAVMTFDKFGRISSLRERDTGRELTPNRIATGNLKL